ncbi:MAG: sarcosine oxidase subunit alpha family protein [Rhodobacterales bacterium]|nr:sarcosine oxidase subunit alpha family protein [Rhodobacterales bacterium]
MTTQSFRNAEGGLIDRATPLDFTFDGKAFQGFAGDTLASALVANGVRLVGRSFKYHRPRGLIGAGVEDPCGLVRLGAGDRAEPNTRATLTELFAGLTADSQNRWPSLKWDASALTGLAGRLFPAGFYYKTFISPQVLWPTYEKIIRAMAGMGTCPEGPDPDVYDDRFAHADLLVVGAGPAGLAAALAAGRLGQRVILAEQDMRLGGDLLAANRSIDGRPALDWVADTVAELEALPDVTLLPRTTVFGYHDHNLLAAVERVTDHLPHAPAGLPRQRHWKIRAGRVVLATGAIERPLVFADNDRPGVMLASAARAYVNRWAARPGTRAVVVTNNDDGYRSALDLQAGGIEIAALLDTRPEGGGALAQMARDAGLSPRHGMAVARALGGHAVTGAEITALSGGGATETVDCDLIAVSGGWAPTLHLHSQARGKATYDESLTAFVPTDPKQAHESVGAAAGDLTLAGALAAGSRAGGDDTLAPPADDHPAAPIQALWQVPKPPSGKGKRFVDIQDDVTAEDVALAHREGYESVEHLKRYTTLGMGTDQGKTSNVNGLAIMAGLRGQTIPAVGTTTFRPPFTPVTMGTFAGREAGHHFAPIRRTPLHARHDALGAVFQTAGLWLRARYYPLEGETMAEAVAREASHVRRIGGMVDVSTLGKIDIQGPDAADLLNRFYVNGFKALPVGKCRYGLMLREDGIVLDDGTTTRIGDTHYYMTTTTANAVTVMRNLELYLQVHWPDLDVSVASVSDQWAGVALAGPRARDLLARVADIDVSNDAFPFLAYREGAVAGIPARLFRISYSGELAYEIHVPSDFAPALWDALLEHGADLDIRPYGTEAMSTLRIEKGHMVIGTEIDGRTTADDLGMGRMVSTKKPFIGHVLKDRPGLTEGGRKQLVGLVPVDKRTPIPETCQIVKPGVVTGRDPVPIEGHVTAGTFSPSVGHPIALALVKDGRARLGETLHAVSPTTRVRVPVTVTSPVFVDPEGERLHA